jgi:electron transport complex protein RnfG
MIPGSQDVVKMGDWTISDKSAEYYKATGAGDQVVGYIIETYGKGYSSNIHSVVAVDPSMKIVNISILGHAETPGLGDGIESKWFKDQFVGKSTSNLEVVKTAGTDKIQALTGATISSRAVVNSEKAALEFLANAIQTSNSVADTDSVQAVAGATASTSAAASDSAKSVQTIATQAGAK